MVQETNQEASEQAAKKAALEKEDREKAQFYEEKVQYYSGVIKTLEQDIQALISSQNYYHRKMREVAKKRDQHLNLRLL